MVIVCHTTLPHCAPALLWCACRARENTSVPPDNKNCNDHLAGATSHACCGVRSVHTASPATSPDTRDCHMCAVAAAVHTGRQRPDPRPAAPPATPYIIRFGPCTAAPLHSSTRAGGGCQSPRPTAGPGATHGHYPTAHSASLCGLLTGGCSQIVHAVHRQLRMRR
jgi:hypothetical protein